MAIRIRSYGAGTRILRRARTCALPSRRFRGTIGGASHLVCGWDKACPTGNLEQGRACATTATPGNRCHAMEGCT